LVPADAFYEWQRISEKMKQPFANAEKNDQPYAFAGLWEKWKDAEAGSELLTFTVITTDPNELVGPMHERMPVIIPEDDYDHWLQAGDPDCLEAYIFQRSEIGRFYLEVMVERARAGVQVNVVLDAFGSMGANEGMNTPNSCMVYEAKLGWACSSDPRHRQALPVTAPFPPSAPA
jgi:hypothetical protein